MRYCAGYTSKEGTPMDCHTDITATHPATNDANHAKSSTNGGSEHESSAATNVNGPVTKPNGAPPPPPPSRTNSGKRSPPTLRGSALSCSRSNKNSTQ